MVSTHRTWARSFKLDFHCEITRDKTCLSCVIWSNELISMKHNAYLFVTHKKVYHKKDHIIWQWKTKLCGMKNILRNGFKLWAIAQSPVFGNDGIFYLDKQSKGNHAKPSSSRLNSTLFFKSFYHEKDTGHKW